MSEMEETLEGIEDMVSDLYKPVPAPAFAHIQALDINLATREIFVGGDISDDFGDWFTSALRYLEVLSHDPVTVWINTPGGDVNSMFTFHDLVRQSPCKIVTIGTGMVCSAGVLMLACGHRRLATESCILMSHRAEETITGDLEQLEAQMKVVKWGEHHWAFLMDRYTPDEVDGKLRDQKHWFALGKKAAQWWITGGEDIVHEGIADAVYEYERLPAPARPGSRR